MWIMTDFGILMPSLRPTDTYDPTQDDRHIQIRARRARDLDYAREHFLPELGETIFIGNTDYQYRAYCTHEQLALMLARIALSIDYVKFKPTTDRHVDNDDLHRLYNRIWSVVLDAFEEGSSYSVESMLALFDDVDIKRKSRKRSRNARRRHAERVAHNVLFSGYSELTDVDVTPPDDWYESEE